MSRRRLTLIASALLLVTLLMPVAADAAALHPPQVLGANLLDKLKDAVLGTLKIGADFFADLFQNMLGGLADMLVPDSLAKKGVEFVKWQAAVPDYTNRAFSDFHKMAHTSHVLAVVLMPAMLFYGAAKSFLGLENSEPPHVVFFRTLAAILVVLSWSHLWKQGAALTNSLSNVYLSMPAVEVGMNKYMEIVVVGGLLTSLPFLGLLIFFLASALFLAGLVLKVFVLLLGAALFAIGPWILVLSADRSGAALIRRYSGAVFAVLSLPVAFSIIYAVSAIFIKSAGPIGNAIGGGGFFGSAAGGLMAGFASLIGPLMCLALAKRALGPVMGVVGNAARSVAPSRIAGKIGAGISAARNGTMGRDAGLVKTSGGGSVPAASAVQRLTQSRTGMRQAAGAGAAAAGNAMIGRGNPARTALRAAQIAVRGGLPGVAAMGGGYAATNIAARTPAPRNPLRKPTTGASTADTANAAVAAMRPEGFRPPTNQTGPAPTPPVPTPPVPTPPARNPTGAAGPSSTAQEGPAPRKPVPPRPVPTGAPGTEPERPHTPRRESYKPEPAVPAPGGPNIRTGASTPRRQVTPDTAVSIPGRPAAEPPRVTTTAGPASVSVPRPGAARRPAPAPQPVAYGPVNARPPGAQRPEPMPPATPPTEG